MKEKRPDAQLLRNVWKDTKEFITKRNVELDRAVLDELIASVFSSGPFYYYVVDFYDMQIKYMNPNIRAIHGVDPDTITFQDIINLIHPDDMDFVSKAEALAWELLYKKIGPDRNHRYKMSYCFRFKVADGSYQLFNHQSIMLNADENGGMAKALNIHTNISHLTSENNFKLSAIGMNGEPSYLNLDVYKNGLIPSESQSVFSKREIEIIRLMADGLNSDEIAQKLFLSVHTIQTHRKNILKKASCNNVAGLVTKCITEGLI